MRTVILSDLHLGNGGPYDIFAGDEALTALVDSLTSEPHRVVLNGDTFDFLLNEDPLGLDAVRAVGQARALVAHPPTAHVMAALGRVLRVGGEVLITLGNHDLELALPEVQDVFRAALQQPADLAGKLSFPVGTAPLLLQVGGATVLIAHGEQADDMNRVDVETLSAPPDASHPFHYPPGSLLVKTLLNPLKRRENMRYMDLLKPDFEGAVLTALGVNPVAVRVVLDRRTLELLQRTLKRRELAPAYAEGDETARAWEGLGSRIAEAGLTEPEAEAISRQLEDSRLEAFGASELLERARLKLLRVGLKWQAWPHRRVLGSRGVEYFAHMPTSTELAEARRLARKYQARAVVMGHTHSARWQEEEGWVFANTGTWIWLLRMPAPEASTDDWADFLLELQDNPSLEPRRQKHARTERHLTCVVIEPAHPDGATMRLAEWTERTLHTLHEAPLRP